MSKRLQHGDGNERATNEEGVVAITFAAEEMNTSFKKNQLSIERLHAMEESGVEGALTTLGWR